LVGARTGHPYGLINPDRDRELNDPQLLLLGTENGEAVVMIKVPRGQIRRNAMTPEQVFAVIAAYEEGRYSRLSSR
jgi:hypothetical protein